MTLPIDIKNNLVSIISSHMEDNRRDIDVFYQLEDAVTAAGRKGWVSVLGGTGEFDNPTFADSLDRYDIVWTYSILVGSGFQATPAESEALSYQLARYTAEAVESNHTLNLGLNGVTQATVVGVTPTEDWPEENKHSVLTVVVRVECAGWPE